MLQVKKDATKRLEGDGHFKPYKTKNKRNTDRKQGVTARPVAKGKQDKIEKKILTIVITEWFLYAVGQWTEKLVV